MDNIEIKDEKPKKGVTVAELKEFILKHMTAEQALDRLLESSLISYNKLRFNKGEEVHPLIIMSSAAMDMGWDFVIEQDREKVEGLIVGTGDYINRTTNWIDKNKEV